MPGLINNKTLIPPFSFGRNVDENEWDRMFPNGVRKSWESEEEYNKRTGKTSTETGLKLENMGKNVGSLPHEATDRKNENE